MTAKRFTIPFLISMLAVLLAVMGQNLWHDLKELSIAGNDSAQWTILQLDNEFANLQSVLIEEAGKPEPDRNAIRLRADIALSRVDLVSQGNSAQIISRDPEAVALLDQITKLAGDAAALVDGDLTAPDIERLKEVTAEARPVARSLALLGLKEVAVLSEARRENFAAKLRNTGFVAIALIGVLGAVLMALNRLLRIAKKQDRALQSSSQRLASTIAASLDAIVTSNAKGEIVDFNPAAEAIFDWEKQDLVGRNIDEVLLPGKTAGSSRTDGSGSGKGLLRYVDQGRVEITARRRTGEQFPAEISVTSAASASDDLVVIYLRDISEQKLSERALIDAKEQAERTDRAKSQFLTIMSHEMRTPLNGILGVLDLLRSTDLTDKQSGYLDVATASSEVLLRHVNEALDIARIEAGSLNFSPHRFNLAAEVRQVVKVLEPLAAEKNLDLIVEIEPGMTADFVGDGARIGQIVMNLVGNAIKFTTRGAISVSLKGVHTAASTTARIIVRDSGKGIPEAHLDAIFEDFVALSHSKGRMSRSDGLGLSISRKLARLMGGDITAKSKEGDGSTFCLTIPLQNAIGPAALPTVGNGIAGPHAPPPSRHPRVLIVDDNSVNLSVLGEMLQKLGCEVAGANSGSEGYDLAMNERFDLIFMDIAMPDMDGVELTRRLREHDGPNKTTRIHGVTAYGEEEYRDLATSAGMDGFSTKPIRSHQLAKALRGCDAGYVVAGNLSDEIDFAVLSELREALGESGLRQTADRFFQEMRESLRDMRDPALPADAERLCKRLHDLRGAAALFGLRSLIEGLDQARSSVEDGDIPACNQALARLDDLTAEARHKLSELAESEFSTAGVATAGV